MTRDEARERVMRYLRDGRFLVVKPEAFADVAAGLIQEARRDALEEAARVCEACHCAGVSSSWDAAQAACAEAIRQIAQEGDS